MFVVCKSKIHTPHTAWCYPVRREGQRCPPLQTTLRHWRCACADGFLPVRGHRYRSVPSRCNICQSYSIYTTLSLPTEVRALLCPPVYFQSLQGAALYAVRAVGGVVGISATDGRYVYSVHRRLSLVTVLMVFVHGSRLMRWYLS